MLIFILVGLAGLAVSVALAKPARAWDLVGFLWFIFDVILSSGIKMAAQWKNAVFRVESSVPSRPRAFFIIPVIDQVRFIDTRVLTLDIPTQQVITKDNVRSGSTGPFFQ